MFLFLIIHMIIRPIARCLAVLLLSEILTFALESQLNNVRPDNVFGASGQIETGSGLFRSRVR